MGTRPKKKKVTAKCSVTNVSHTHTLLSDWPMSAVKHEQFSLQFVSVPGLPLNSNMLQPHSWAIFLAILECGHAFPPARPQSESDGGAWDGREGGRWSSLRFRPSLSASTFPRVHLSRRLTATTPPGPLTSSACHCQ